MQFVGYVDEHGLSVHFPIADEKLFRALIEKGYYGNGLAKIETINDWKYTRNDSNNIY